MTDTLARTDKLAELFVEDVCVRAGAAVQRPSEDQHGWDLMVEFPSREVANLPDLQEPVRRCLIQVKSTRSRAATCQVKLSNALKFAKEPLPCFVVHLTYPEGRAKPEAAYLRHFWTPMIAEALLRARTAGAERRPLNRQRLSLRFSEAERCESDIAGALVSAIDLVGPSYGQQKSDLGESIGYEDGYGEAQFTLAPGVKREHLEDVFLGLRDNVEISDFVITDRRFGIAAPPESQGSGLMSITQLSDRKCAVSMERRRTGEEVSWPGLTYGAPLPGIAPADMRFRVVAGPMDIILQRGGVATAKWNHDLDRATSLEDLSRAVTVRSWLGTNDLHLAIWGDGRRLVGSDLQYEVGDVDVWEDARSGLAALTAVAPPERRPADLTLTLRQILSARERLQNLVRYAGPQTSAVKVEMASPWDANTDGLTHLIVPWVLELGGFAFISVIEREVLKAFHTDTQILMSTTRGRLLRGSVLPVGPNAMAVAAADVEWARAQALTKDKRILSWVPQPDETGNLVLSWDDGN